MRKILTLGILDNIQNINYLDSNSVTDDSLIYAFSNDLREF